MQDLTPEARQRLDAIAARHGVSTDAAATLLRALAQGGGTMAQFSHPELGGMGQWSQGGMIMVGDMFNQGLRARVDALCTELAGLLREGPVFAAPAPGAAAGGFGGGFGGNWWPAELGAPASSGG
ncbi:MAG: SHOCT domain-containing protein, partial [Paracraurococcus sp.]